METDKLSIVKGKLKLHFLRNVVFGSWPWIGSHSIVPLFVNEAEAYTFGQIQPRSYSLQNMRLGSLRYTVCYETVGSFIIFVK